jgi:hypothetical protein
MAGRWRTRRRCGAKTRKGTPCLAKALPNGRCKHHGGLSTGIKTEAGKQRQAAGIRAWWDPEERSKFMSAVAQRQVKVMRRILAAERARRGLTLCRSGNSRFGPRAATSLLSHSQKADFQEDKPCPSQKCSLKVFSNV